ncbi:MAG: AAA family ATPase [Desulfobacterales bacterium]
MGRAVYLDSLWQAEQAIAGRMLAMLSVATPSRCQTLDAVLAEVENQLIISLSAEQRDVLENIVSLLISIITGGPGTGKTTLIKAITEMNRIFGRRICLCAPTAAPPPGAWQMSPAIRPTPFTNFWNTIFRISASARTGTTPSARTS